MPVDAARALVSSARRCERVEIVWTLHIPSVPPAPRDPAGFKALGEAVGRSPARFRSKGVPIEHHRSGPRAYDGFPCPAARDADAFLAGRPGLGPSSRAEPGAQYRGLPCVGSAGGWWTAKEQLAENLFVILDAGY